MARIGAQNERHQARRRRRSRANSRCPRAPATAAPAGTRRPSPWSPNAGRRRPASAPPSRRGSQKWNGNCALLVKRAEQDEDQSRQIESVRADEVARGEDRGRGRSCPTIWPSSRTPAEQAQAAGAGDDRAPCARHRAHPRCGASSRSAGTRRGWSVPRRRPAGSDCRTGRCRASIP